MIAYTHLHAMVVHFPIALLLVGFLSDVIGLVFKKEFFQKAALYLLILGTVGALTAYFSGEAAGEGIEEGSLGKAVALHEQAAFITLWVTIAALLLRLGAVLLKQRLAWMKGVAFVLFAATVGAVSYTGYLGGQLVYKHAAGVELGMPDISEADAAEITN